MAAVTLMAGSAGAQSTQRSPASLECSKEADAKGLHGKQRREFRSKCKYGFKHPGGRDQQGSWGQKGSQDQQGSWGQQGSQDRQGSWGQQGSQGRQGSSGQQGSRSYQGNRETQGSRPSGF